ncbi:MAG: exonuclease domain-containing protein [Defluviitaleaceae bacterium]|nr:exonuclease domain-containing protein [Defluviitaleaceae bacterium]
MNYIIIDLEYNQNFDFKTGAKAPSNPLLPLEIIQIGAVKMDSRHEIIDKFGTTVAPRLYRGLNPFVARVTGLTGAQLRKSPPFYAAYRGLLRFIGNEDALLCFWGNDDVRELFRNILFYRQNPRRLPLGYINIQRMAALHLELPAKQQMALGTMVANLDIDTPLPFHNAPNDAYYTAEIFKRIYNEKNLGIQSFDLEKLILHNMELKAKSDS